MTDTRTEGVIAAYVHDISSRGGRRPGAPDAVARVRDHERAGLLAADPARMEGRRRGWQRRR